LPYAAYGVDEEDTAGPLQVRRHEDGRTNEAFLDHSSAHDAWKKPGVDRRRDELALQIEDEIGAGRFRQLAARVAEDDIIAARGDASRVLNPRSVGCLVIEEW